MIIPSTPQYSHDEIVTIHPRDQRTATKVYCFNCAAHGHYGFVSTTRLYVHKVLIVIIRTLHYYPTVK